MRLRGLPGRRKLGIQYQYLYAQVADITQLNQIVEQAIPVQPDGIAVRGLDPNGSRSVIQRAVDAGIAVVLTPPENTSTSQPLRGQKLPYIGQVGAPGFYFDGLVGLGLFVAVILNEWFLRNVDRFRGRVRTTPATTPFPLPGRGPG